MAPTGPITSWQILLEIRAASSRSVGWARSVIEETSVLVGLEARPATHEQRTPRWLTDRLRKGFALIHASRRPSKGHARRHDERVAESIAFESLLARALWPVGDRLVQLANRGHEIDAGK